MFSLFSKKTATVTLKDDPSVRRSHISPAELVTLPEGGEVRTMADVFSYTARKYGDKVACRYRDVLGVVDEVKEVSGTDGPEKKTWKYFTLSDPKPVTHNELDEQTSQIASAILHLGITSPSTPLVERPRASIYADTSMNWQIFSQAFARLGIVITTAYTTLGREGLLTSLVEPHVSVIFCGEGQIKMVREVVQDAKDVKWVIYDGEDRAETTLVSEIQDILSGRGGRILLLSEIIRLGQAHPVPKDALGVGPKSEDLFCIMYTSGSTGPPKGVLLTHGNMVASLAGATKLWGKYFDPKTDLLMAYLPLAHILEQFLEFTFYLLGVEIGYATVKTLLDDSVRNCKGDFAAYRPTLIGGVPAIYEMIRKGMKKKIADAGPVVGAVFSLAVKGKQTLPRPLGAVIDKVLFARVKAATGGRLRLAVCGGGALSKETQTFLGTVLAPMMQGYGLTETCGMATITTPDFWLLGSVGTLGPSCEMKLADQPELGYSSTATPPRGEIWLRGPNIFKGYHERPELDAAAFTEDGWFKTGDIGQIESNGTLTIIDRIKHLIKLQNGEYIALDKVESVYKACDVTMMLCLVAPPGADRPIAIVYPHEGNLRHHLTSAGIPSDGTPKEWVKSEEVKNYVLGAMRETAKTGGLGKVEMIKDVVLTPEEWSPENGLLTATMKLNRPEIAKQFAKQIEAAYAK